MYNLSKFLNAESRPLSCGLAIVSNGKSLIVHATGSPDYVGAWNFPKGVCNPGEDELSSAKREVKEETTLNIDSYQYEEKGTIEYQTKNKRYKFFIVLVDEDITKVPLTCNSYFNDYGVSLPEVDVLKWVSYAELQKYTRGYPQLEPYMEQDAQIK